MITCDDVVAQHGVATIGAGVTVRIAAGLDFRWTAAWPPTSLGTSRPLLGRIPGRLHHGGRSEAHVHMPIKYWQQADKVRKEGMRGGKEIIIIKSDQPSVF